MKKSAVILTVMFLVLAVMTIGESVYIVYNHQSECAEMSTVYKTQQEKDKENGIIPMVITITGDDGEWASGTGKDGLPYVVTSDRVEVGDVIQATVNDEGEIFTLKKIN
ncbi:hypothetical protein [Bacillus mycoides]|uniref:hypothetical protein n=1 Tax=Bacillus mycoides TaxID=1405 RepID=UPI000BF937B6|nr:hypothetical protein [Bacillus mycoides]PGA05585.1 hypothetical protein COL71_25575 [Bacillus mycoides]